ncbi:cytochrome c [Pontibacter korlensis]|uniref:Cytochrome c class I n=1 Tax=Pontibacter korlensis TaxID=400092 RepID=A0A0E3UZH6_9BACT|nr:cytochrome c [Pontibacter korlensis]AKD05356.1 cytochrome c class I [Pontibacter korlensis]
MRKNNLVVIALGAFALTTLTQCFTNKKDEGKRLYEQHCQSCHMEDGSGLKGLIPPLAQADYLQTHRDELPCIIRHGMEGSIVVNGVEYNKEMPGVESMRDDQMTNLLNYIQTNLGNNNQRYTMPEVEELLQACPKR